MKNIYYGKLLFFFTLLLGITHNVYATNEITVADGYIKVSIPGSDITAAYMTINNTSSKAITLQKVSSTISDRVEIHQHNMSDGMMRMREVGQVTIDAHSKVLLRPSGLHLMIFSIKQKITEKDVIPFTLYFSNETKLNIQLPVYR